MEEIYLSARELGEIINCPVRTIENWAAARKIVQDKTGKYGLISAFKEREKSLEEKLATTLAKLEEAEASDKESIRLASTRKAIAEADKEEAIAAIKKLELARMESSLVDAESVELLWANLIANCVAKFNSLPAKLALQLSGIDRPEEIENILTNVIREALSELGDSNHEISLKNE